MQVYPQELPLVELQLQGMGGTEKNWSPIKVERGGERLLISRFFNPHQVGSMAALAMPTLSKCCLPPGSELQPDGRSVHRGQHNGRQRVSHCADRGRRCLWSANKSVADYASQFHTQGKARVHLSTNAVLSPDNSTYIAIVHVKYTMRRYTNYFYEFMARPPYKILRVATQPAELLLPPITCFYYFTSSLLKISHDEYLVGYGDSDRAGAVSKLKYADIELTLRDGVVD